MRVRRDCSRYQSKPIRYKNQIEQVSSVMNEIASASANQENGVHSVNQAVQKLDRLTQQTSASVEQSAATAEVLNPKHRK
jgi:methyl-accepting chemotaxis protein I, serine sensor receptor